MLPIGNALVASRREGVVPGVIHVRFIFESGW